MSDIENVLNSYFEGNCSEPFFAVIKKYPNFIGIEAKIKNISDFCINEDALPDIDDICETIKNNTEKLVIRGLAEYLRFIETHETERIMKRVRDIQGKGKTVFLCRGLRKSIEQFTKDPRFDNRRYKIFDSPQIYSDDIKIIPFRLENFNRNTINGFKNLLRDLEQGKEYNFLITQHNINIPKYNNSYECIKLIIENFNVPETFGTEERWKDFLDYLQNNENSIPHFEKYNFNDWKCFIALKYNGSTTNNYLQIVLDKTNSFDDFKRNILNTILDYPYNTENFVSLAQNRKDLLVHFKEPEIAEFVAESKIKGNERINYLTDSSLVEKKAILECGIAKNYPDLENYLKPFEFKYREYFDTYKKQKLQNKVDSDFLRMVSQNAKDRMYNLLPARDEILGKINSQNTKLYFIDALGVEFLAFIQNECNEHGLRIDVKIARANLPSITSLNKDFYETWPNEKDYRKELDKIKHEGKEQHLADELEVIKKILESIAIELKSRKSEKIIISSDHGASRLCVLNGQELKYDVGSKGEHSGRCCPINELTDKPENATEENDFWVLADYGRFRGSRKAMIEVHGGASLEEVVVPIIEISLAGKIVFKLENQTTTSSYRKKPEIILFSTTKFQKLFVEINNKKYDGEKLDENKHKFIFEVLKAGKYNAQIFDDKNNRVGSVEFEVKKEIAQEMELL